MTSRQHKTATAPRVASKTRHDAPTEAPTFPTLVFVYGTLRNDLPSIRGMVKGLPSKPATLAGWHMTAQKWSGYPAAYPTDNDADTLIGQVLTVNDAGLLQEFDYLEGHPSFFCRQVVLVKVGDAYVHAWIYRGPARTANQPVVASGDWLQYIAEHKEEDADDLL